MHLSKVFKLLFSTGAATIGLLYVLNQFEKVNASTERNLPMNISAKWDINWDRRDPYHLVDPKKIDGLEGECLINILNKHTPKSVRHLIFIRHGQYNHQLKENAKRTLTSLGKEQADCTGIRLKELCIEFDQVFESSSPRALETSSIIRSHLNKIPTSTTDLLREGSPVLPDPPYEEWGPEFVTFTESPRIEAIFRKYVHRADLSQEKDSYEIFVCHGNVIRYVVCRALQLPPSSWMRMSLLNGSITWLTVHPDGEVTVRCVGEVGHIPSDKISMM